MESLSPLRTHTSPTLYVYGYEIDQVKGVKYLVKEYPTWARTYNLFSNHVKAMEAIAKVLSEKCGLALHGIPLWVGGHHMGYGVVFYGESMVPGERTPEDTKKLNKLEGLLESMAILKTEKAKFGVLCSAVCRAYPVEPPLIARQPRPSDWERNVGHELMSLMDDLIKKYPRGKRAKNGKHQADCGAEPTPDGEGTDSRCVLSSWSPALAMLM